jgi:hypothetical protein
LDGGQQQPHAAANIEDHEHIILTRPTIIAFLPKEDNVISAPSAAAAMTAQQKPDTATKEQQVLTSATETTRPPIIAPGSKVPMSALE